MTVSWLDIELDIGIECHGYVIYIMLMLLQNKTSLKTTELMFVSYICTLSFELVNYFSEKQRTH